MAAAERRQKGPGSVIIWAGIVNQIISQPFKGDEGGKSMESVYYCDFMHINFFTWYKSHSASFKEKCVFMHGIALSYVSKLTCEFFEHEGFTG